MQMMPAQMKSRKNWIFYTVTKERKTLKLLHSPQVTGWAAISTHPIQEYEAIEFFYRTNQFECGEKIIFIHLLITHGDIVFVKIYRFFCSHKKKIHSPRMLCTPQIIILWCRALRAHSTHLFHVSRRWMEMWFFYMYILVFGKIIETNSPLWESFRAIVVVLEAW